MEEAMPAAYAELMQVRDKLEQHYRDMQDIEFTVQQHKLYMLQTRNGKRTAAASLRIAVEMAQEGLIDQHEAVQRVNPASLDQLLHPTLDPKAPRTLLAKGLPASPGAASGAVVFTADEAEMRARPRARRSSWCAIETSPEDIHGMHAAQGILTTRGGMTSHAAVVARGMGRPCVAGAGGIAVDYGAQTLSGRRRTVRAGDIITLDGATGEVFVGTVRDDRAGDVRRFRHADGLGRRGAPHEACAPTPKRRWTPRPRANSAPRASACAAPSTCSSTPQRIGAVRQMIMANDEPAAAPRWRSCCRSSARISSSCSASWPDCRSPSACSIRRCTNSCRTARRNWPRWPRRWAPMSKRCAGAPRNSPRPTRCSAIAAAAWASPIRKSTRCRHARSSRARIAVARKPATRRCRRS